MKYPIAIAALLFGMNSCASTSLERRADAIRKRSMEDLHCPSDEVVLELIDEVTIQATGCGKGALYSTYEVPHY